MPERTRAENEAFEDEVRRIARQLWPAAEFGGAAVVGGRERDGVFETEESIHLLEVTSSRRKAKAEEDCKKLADLGRTLERRTRHKGVRRWFITRDEPTADQRQVAERFQVTAVSFTQFQSRLVDSRSYMAARDEYFFGSVRDPATGDKDPSVDFVPLGLSSLRDRSTKSLNELLANIQSGGRVVVLGDYGAGKSMTLRYIYQQLRRRNVSGESAAFPVFINLRDHYGQTDPAELLHRHARLIGFPHPDHLIRAWRSGYVHLLLDGFDETTSLNLHGLWTRLRENRYRAMEIVRRFTDEHPANRSGIVLAGRAHFFDNDTERRTALGLTDDWNEFSLNEFTDEQIYAYLRKSGVAGSVPAWLPSRPLLVAYLAAKGLLAELIADRNASAVVGWDLLLEGIASRESQIQAGIDGDTIRRILERLATKARTNVSGLGPLNHEALLEAFREVCGYPPDERGMVLLQRLPGLGADKYEDGSRALIDEEFADACRAGDLVHFARDPYQFEQSILTGFEIVTGQLGVQVAAKRARDARLSSGQLNAAIRRSVEIAGSVLTADVARLTLELGHDVESGTTVRGVLIPELDLSVTLGDGSRLTFLDCFFRRVDIDPEAIDDKLPGFHSCFIDEVDGRVSRADLPNERFDTDCIIESFVAAASTTAEVLALELPLGTKVALTILKKLYDRRGSGRRESALYRGLDQRAQRLVPEALRVIQNEGLANSTRRGNETIWLPDRGSARRVGQMISAPMGSDDRLLQRTAEI